MVYDSLSQDTEIKLIRRISQYLTNKNFIDIGAEKGSFASAMLELGLHGVLFEPMPKHLSALQQLVASYTNVRLYDCAITNVDTKLQFNVATDSEGKELDYFHSLQKADLPGVFAHSKSFEVDCRSLKSLVEKSEIPPTLGILKTDTEGNDLNVLRGLGDLRPELIICEYFMPGLYDGWTEAAPELVIDYMRTLGYRTFLATKRIGELELIGMGATMYQEKQWGNLFFFRDDFYVKADGAIAESILIHEQQLSKKFSDMNLELEAKENVIQQLLLQKQELAAKKSPRSWFERVLNAFQRHKAEK